MVLSCMVLSYTRKYGYIDGFDQKEFTGEHNFDKYVIKLK